MPIKCADSAHRGNHPTAGFRIIAVPQRSGMDPAKASGDASPPSSMLAVYDHFIRTTEPTPAVESQSLSMSTSGRRC
jgi:hypothetical protein